MKSSRIQNGVLISALAFGLTGCIGGGSEPSEAEMRDAMEYMMNHPAGVVNAAPIKITSFKKEACDNPTPQGYKCTFAVMVASTNPGAGMYNNVPFGMFYKDSGKWIMRPPF